MFARQPSDQPASFTRALIRGSAALALALALGFAPGPGAGPAQATPEGPRLDDLRELPSPARSVAGNFLAAHVAGFAGDTSASATFYRRLFDSVPDDPGLLENAFIAFLADGDMTYALRAAERILDLDQDNSLAQLAQAVGDIRQERFAAARSRLEPGGRGSAADLTATLLRAWSYAGSGLEEDALLTVDRLEGEGSYEIFRLYHGALMASFLGETEIARERFAAALEAQPRALSIVDAYARFAARDGRRDEAVAAYDTFLENFTRHPIARANRDALRAGENLPRAVSSVNEGASEVLYGLGSVGIGDGDDLVALIYLRLALHLAPAHDMALATLAELLESREQYAAAIETFNAIPTSSPLHAGAQVDIGMLLERLDRKEDAIAHLEAMIARDAENREAIVALANIQRMRRNFPEAAETYSRAIDLIETPDSGDWTLFFFRGASLERSGEWERAEADLKQALKLVPQTSPLGEAQILNYIGYSWVDMGMRLDEGYAKIQRAIELAPNDGHIIDSLGWAYYRLGRYEEAVRELERAIEHLPNDPVVNDHLGDVYWRVGRRLEARFQWERALSNDPEDDDRKMIERKLEMGLDEAEAYSRKSEAGETGGESREGG
ncbi:MAG: tetratricopeptide repeat protein [Salinarimonas sp.]|nr:tetratricopeptide repeat protein [Salinarimonas sp.]